MNTNIGVNLNKELRYLSKRKRMPKIRHNNCHYSENTFIEPMINKYSKNISNIISYIKDKTADFKSSVNSGTSNENNSKVDYFCCKEMLNKKNIAFMSIGALAAGYGIKCLLKRR